MKLLFWTEDLYTFGCLLITSFSKAICSEFTDFFFTIVFFGKGKTTLTKPFSFKNESSFGNPFWKWKHFYVFYALLKQCGLSEAFAFCHRTSCWSLLCWLFLMTCSKPSSVSQKAAFPRLDNHPKDVLLLSMWISNLYDGTHYY